MIAFHTKKKQSMWNFTDELSFRFMRTLVKKSCIFKTYAPRVLSIVIWGKRLWRNYEHRGEAELHNTCDECGNDQNKIPEYLLTLRAIHIFSKLQRQYKWKLLKREKVIAIFQVLLIDSIRWLEWIKLYGRNTNL